MAAGRSVVLTLASFDIGLSNSSFVFRPSSVVRRPSSFLRRLLTQYPSYFRPPQERLPQFGRPDVAGDIVNDLGCRPIERQRGGVVAALLGQRRQVGQDEPQHAPRANL